MRYYQNIYPKLNDTVVVQVKTLSDIGAYVSLLEYNGIEGMIPISELTNRKFKSYNKLTRIGKLEICSVIAVDELKECIDLSKKSVTTKNLVKCEQKWNKSKIVQNIISHISDMCSVPIIDIHKLITWKLYEKYGHAYDAFRMYLYDPFSVPEIDKLSETHQDLYKLLTDNIRKIIKPFVPSVSKISKIFKIRSEINLTCFTKNGLVSIKESIDEVLKYYEKISIKFISSPTFLLLTETTNKEEGIALLYNIIDVIKIKIKKLGGDLQIKTQPYIK